MEWLFSVFFLISIIHMVEEYFYPGGFMERLKNLNPKFAPLVTKPMAIIINGLQLLLCLAAIAVGEKALAFSMSVGALLFINGVIHVLACIRIRGYAPGVMSGVLLYIPLSGYAYFLGIHSGRLTLNGVITSGILGLLYQAVPISYFVLARAIRSL